MILRPLVAALLAFAASPSFAEEVQLSYWEHGSWRVALVEDTQWNMRSCRVWTGGDGNGTLALHVGGPTLPAQGPAVPVPPLGEHVDPNQVVVGPDGVVNEIGNDWEKYIDPIPADQNLLETVSILQHN